ncbi:MAG: ZIP family metal transporter, partial [Chloroflexi bacterium]|nr:ZIP family metal transporter [Chloroflexota bacterium]
MLAWLEQFSPVTQALIATLFTWFVTALGAATVLFTKTVNRRLLDGMLGMAAGVMIAASFWSLLAPAIDLSGGSIVPAVVGFLVGGIVLRGIDRILPHVHPALRAADVEGLRTSWQRSTLLVLAVTLHNIPEGLAVGVAFGAAAAGLGDGSIAGAVALAVGIGLQNFPEGAAVAMPLRREEVSRGKAFFLG